MTNRKSFVLYTDMLQVREDLDADQNAELFKAICDYNEGKDVEVSVSIKPVWRLFKNQFDRDNDKYLKTCQKRAEAGRKGGSSKSKQNQANANKSKQGQAKQADNDTDNDTYTDTLNYTDTDTDTDKLPPTPQGVDSEKRAAVEPTGETPPTASVSFGGAADLEVWPTFDDFWDAYDKKVEKPVCEKKWKKLKQSDKEAIMQHVPAYVESTPDKAFRKNPQTYLNKKTWTDEEIITKNSFNNGQQNITNLDPKEVAAYVRSVFAE